MAADRSVSAAVFNIQSYSIHDGPGIRVTVFVKGCPLRCVWCANPESNLSKPQLLCFKDKCTACGRCIPKCPNHAISIKEKDGKVYAFTDRSLCRDCGQCVDACLNEAREMAGEEMSVETVLNRVLKDKLFMKSSGGGMTLSGGEMLFCPDFSENLLMAAREEGLHTAVESSCFASRQVIDRVFPHVDLALCDLKHMDSRKHREYTGVPNETILENIRHIYHDLKVPIWARVPCITGYNDDKVNIAATAKFVREELGEDVRVCLLPYHRLGESKNESLGKDINWSIEIPTEEYMLELKELVEKYGLTAQIGG
ncbi:MAG: glycyl-radical enzyme activating protein [Blautia sp.]|nr:glycyl-radical enzyme activating protein [Blautia sp.]